MASAEDKQKIATHYILSAPPGQVAEVERDVLALLGTGMEASRLEGVYRAYNTANHVVVRKSADTTVGLVLCAEGQVDAAGTQFLDSQNKRIFKVNHRAGTAEAGEILSEEDAAAIPQLDPSLEAYRAAAASAAAGHVNACYNPMTAGTQPWARGAEAFSKDGSIVIATSSLVRNLVNFWSGSWRGRYTVGFPAGVSAGKAVVTGTIRITTHYFENGNTQMHSEKILDPISIDFRDPESFGKALVKAIGVAEDNLHDATDDMYESLSNQALKEMRRFLPVSAQKMNWNVLEHRMRKTLQTTSTGAGKA